MEAETAARMELDAALKRLGQFQKEISTGQQLLQALQSYEEALKLYHHHDAYLHLRCSLNRKDPACEANGKLGAEVNARTAFLIPEILTISEEQLQAFQSNEPDLKGCQFALQDIRRDAAHVLPSTEQALLDRLHPEVADWQYDLYEQILAATFPLESKTGPPLLPGLETRDSIILSALEGGVRGFGGSE